jgi:cell division protein FtsQ
MMRQQKGTAGTGRAAAAGTGAAGTAAGAGAAVTAVAGGPASGPATGERIASGPGRAATSRKGDPWKTAFFGVMILAIIAGAAWALLGSSLLVVRSVQVGGTPLVSRSRILAAAGIKLGTPLIRIDTAAVARRVDQITQVQSARVSRAWPDKVEILVQDRTPGVAVAQGRRFALIDKYGVIVRWARDRPSGLPLLSARAARAPVAGSSAGPAPAAGNSASAGTPPVPGSSASAGTGPAAGNSAPARTASPRMTATALRGSPAVRAAVTILQQLPASLRRRVVAVRAPAASTVALVLRGGITILWGDPSRPAAKAIEVTALMRGHASYFDVSDPNTVVAGG